MFSFLVSPSHDRGCSLSCANTLFCCSHVSSWEKTEGKEEMDRWGDVALHPNQCNRRPYQTASQSGEREGETGSQAKQSAHPSVWPPPSRHLFISPSVLSLVLMSCLAIVSPGLFQSNPPWRTFGRIAGSSSYRASPLQSNQNPEGETHRRSDSSFTLVLLLC